MHAIFWRVSGTLTRGPQTAFVHGILSQRILITYAAAADAGQGNARGALGRVPLPFDADGIAATARAAARTCLVPRGRAIGVTTCTALAVSIADTPASDIALVGAILALYRGLREIAEKVSATDLPLGRPGAGTFCKASPATLAGNEGDMPRVEFVVRGVSTTGRSSTRAGRTTLRSEAA